MDSLLVPVRPHVLKYLHKHLGSIYFLSESDPFGLFLFHLLRKPITEARRDHVLTSYPTKWSVGLGAYEFAKKGFRPLSGKAVHQFNVFVHELVMNELCAYVELATDHGQQAKFSIEGFMLKYNFAEEDIQFDTLKKTWSRYLAQRKAGKKKVHSLTGRLHVKELQKQVQTVVGQAQRAA